MVTLWDVLPLSVVAVPQLLQLVLAPLHVILGQTLQTLLLVLHHLADVSWRQETHHCVLILLMLLIVVIMSMCRSTYTHCGTYSSYPVQEYPYSL